MKKYSDTRNNVPFILVIGTVACLFGCQKSTPVKHMKGGLTLEKGIENFPLGSSIRSAKNLSIEDTIYEANWIEEAGRVTFASDFAALWDFRWGDFSYYSSRDGYTVFFKHGLVFAHLISSRGPNNEFDLKNGIHIGMPIDSVMAILKLPKTEPSYYQRYVTDSLALFTKDYKVTSYCILSPLTDGLFCSQPFNGSADLVRRALDTCRVLGVDIRDHNSICIDEEKNWYRIQIEKGTSRPYLFNFKRFKFQLAYSTGFWFDKQTKKCIRVEKPKPD